ncbi:ABC transporter permease [Candidatus Saccharibacteria bacterium]|nr:ABC transporter permease [Candidatus Saccharibacteria bacterium]
MTTKIQRIKARYRYSAILLRELVVSDFKLRYQNSVLGYFWSLLRPFSLFVILYLVFVKILKAGGDIPHFGVYLLVGIIVWNYFAEVTNNSVTSIVGKGDLLRKVNFPRYIIVVAGSCSALINLFFNFIIVAIFMLIANTEIATTVLLLPLLIMELFVFTLAIGFLLSALYVRYRDLSFIWEVIMQGLFFATPIMYDFAFVSGPSPLLAKILISNPIAQLMQDMRYMLVTEKTETLGSTFGTPVAYLIPITIVVVTSVLAGLYFRSRAPYFAEEV